ncbi:hypothetical protein PCE1_002694 [Barthelona sp. PCE]
MFLFVGQCGTQIGCRLFKFLSLHCKKEPKYRSLFFYKDPRDGQWVPRCILVDKEPKVIESALEMGLNIKHFVYEQGGSSNNWAHGFIHQESTLTVQRVCDEVDYIRRMGFLGHLHIIHSLAGGTGGGFGSKLIFELHRYLPNAMLHSYCILPMMHPFRELTLQSMNSALTLSYCFEYCSSVCMFPNDVISKLLNNISRINPHLEVPDKLELGHINDIIAHAVFQLVYPLKDCIHPIEQCVVTIGRVFTCFSSALVSEERKFYSFQNANSVIGDCLQFYPKYTLQHENNTCLRLFNIIRSKSATIPPTNIFRNLCPSENVVSMISKDDAYSMWGLKSAATIACFPMHLVDILLEIVRSSSTLLHSEGFIHHYTKLGLKKQVLEERLEYFTNAVHCFCLVSS